MTDFIAGPFTATFGGTSIGIVEDGFEIEETYTKEVIRGSNLGDIPQDAVYQGGNCFVNFVLLEYDLVPVRQMINPYADTAGTPGNMGPIGRLDVQDSLTKQLVLTVIAGTPAAAVDSNLGAGAVHEDTYTFTRCIVAEDFPIRRILASRLRRFPMRLRVYADSNGDFYTVGGS